MIRPPSDRHTKSELVTVAREARGLTQSELAARLGVSQGLLSKIEAGLSVPTSVVLEGLSRELGYPEEFFFQSEQIYGPSTSEFHHRKKADTPAKLLAQLHAQINIRRIHVGRLRKSIDPEECRIARYDLEDFNGDPAEVARAVRADLQLPCGPLKNVVETIEDAGGIVLRWSFPTRSVDAISRWVPGYPPLFIVNADLPADRERISLCHELGHMVMHQTVSQDMEDEANRFAAEFLMPAADIRGHLEDLRSLHHLANLKPYWKASMQALLKRASDLAIIPEGRARYLWIQIGKAGYKVREPAELDFADEIPTYVSDLIDFHRNELGFTLDDLSKLLTLFPPELQQMYACSPTPGDRTQLRVVK